MDDPLNPVAFEFPNETHRHLPNDVRTRLEGKPEQSADELRAESQRNTERSARLRDAHLTSVKERAARESQRADEARARQRRTEAEEVRERAPPHTHTKKHGSHGISHASPRLGTTARHHALCALR